MGGLLRSKGSNWIVTKAIAGVPEPTPTPETSGPIESATSEVHCKIAPTANRAQLRDGVQLETDDRILTISGEKRSEREEEREQRRYTERIRHILSVLHAPLKREYGWRQCTLRRTLRRWCNKFVIAKRRAEDNPGLLSPEKGRAHRRAGLAGLRMIIPEIGLHARVPVV